MINYNKNIGGLMGLRTFSITKVNPESKKGKYLNSLQSVL